MLAIVLTWIGRIATVLFTVVVAVFGATVAAWLVKKLYELWRWMLKGLFHTHRWRVASEKKTDRWYSPRLDVYLGVDDDFAPDRFGPIETTETHRVCDKCGDTDVQYTSR
ncbi:MAG: hypothetical protein ACHREM_01150 [Polyangiales bacterium]